MRVVELARGWTHRQQPERHGADEFESRNSPRSHDDGDDVAWCLEHLVERWDRRKVPGRPECVCVCGLSTEAARWVGGLPPRGQITSGIDMIGGLS